MELNQAVLDVIDTNDSLVEQVESIPNSVSGDAVVYKLLQLTLSTLSRLSDLYKGDGQLFEQGLIESAYGTINHVVANHVKEVTKEEN